MQTYLVLSKDDNFINTKVSYFRKKFQISTFDIHQIAPDKSLGIADVRKLQNSIKNKPISGNYQLIIIYSIDQATLEAQNALLKLLEEPSPSTIIIATGYIAQKILPTVLSRAAIIKSREKQPTSHNELDQVARQFKKLLELSSGARLNFIQEKLKNREEALNFIENLTTILEDNLLNSSLPLKQKETALIIKKAQQTRRFLEANVNFKLVLDVFLLGLPNITL